jgi:hypothetical protein
VTPGPEISGAHCTAVRAGKNCRGSRS